MSTARTFNPITGGGVDGAFISGDPFRHQEVEDIREALDMAIYNGGSYDLGGSDDVGLFTASYLSVVAGRDILLDVDSLDGLVLDLIVWSRTTDAGTSVTLRLRNTNDSTDAAVSTTITATTLTKETITAVLASGPKTYRLEMIGGNADAAVLGYGVLRCRAVPA